VAISPLSGEVGPPHHAEHDLGTPGSGGRPTPGIASATKHAEQADAEEHQARRLGDGGDGDDAVAPAEPPPRPPAPPATSMMDAIGT